MNRILKRSDGSVAVEFALFAPLFALILNIAAELTMAIHQANILEKSIFAGALLAAQSEYPIPEADETAIENVVKYGNVAGTGDFVVPGWADEEATVTVSTSLYDLNGDNVPVVNISVSVPYEPTIPSLNLINNFTGFQFNFSHEHLLSN